MPHVDTTFLIELLREAKRGIAGPATKRLEELALSLRPLRARGGRGRHRPARRGAKASGVADGPLALALPDAGPAERYGALLATLDRQGETVATMDLLIAATVLADGARLGTRNGRHFGWIPGLEVVTN